MGKKEKQDERERFRRAIFDLIEHLTRHRLSARSKDLILHYFNDSRGESSLQRALETIEKYYPESLPPENERPPKLQELLDALRRAAHAWDGSGRQ
jgi:hypothetical protein